MDKKALRAVFLKKRADMEKSVRKVLDEKIYNNLISCERVKSADIVLTYISAPKETDTLMFAREMLRLGKTVAAPRCMGKQIRFFRIHSLGELRTSSFGVPEPTGSEEITGGEGSVCITPGLAFDPRGYRLGYGGGYYDRFLKDYRGYSIGICYSEFISEIPVDIFDMKTDELITERLGGKEVNSVGGKGI